MPNRESRRSIARPALAACLAVAAAGCARSTSQVDPASGTPMAIAASIDRTWTASMDVMADRHLPIGTTDRAGGLIVVNPTRVNPGSSVTELRGTAHPWADCGSVEHEYYQPNSASYAIHVGSAGAGSTVALAITFSAANAGSLARPCTSKGVLEAELGKEIKEHAERRGP